MKIVKLGVAAVLVLGIAGFLGWRWYEGRVHPSTDDAYLQAHVINIAPQVAGRVTEVAVSDATRVAAGDTLFTLDPATYQAARDGAAARLAQARQSAGAQGDDVGAAEATLAQAQSQLTEAQSEYDRQARLFELGDVSAAARDQATAARDSAQAAVDRARSALEAARAQAGQPGDDNPQVRAAEADLAAAELNLAHTRVTAPADGWIANLSLRPGAVVSAGQPLFAMVEAGDWWIDANFKETDLTRIRPGQPVTIEVDMYPDLELKGRVESIGAGSGAVFSLLPPENATGNWVKVTQRFPVRVTLDETPTDPAMQLRVGASVTARVDTTAQPK